MPGSRHVLDAQLLHFGPFPSFEPIKARAREPPAKQTSLSLKWCAASRTLGLQKGKYRAPMLVKHKA